MTRRQMTILVDNPAADGLLAEHGFSLWIEDAGRRILFDTGQGAAILANARALGIDVGRADDIVLSHGHYDHTGWLDEIVALASRACVFLGPEAMQPRYSIREGTAKAIAMPAASREAVLALPEQRRRWVSRPVCPAPGIGITGPIPRNNSFEDVGGPFFLDAAGSRPDPIGDDMALYIRTDSGLVVCLGCCHAGVVNTLDCIVELTGEPRIRTLLGGLHLAAASERRMEQTIAALRTRDIGRMILCHCTGAAAAERLAQAFPGRVSTGYAGLTVPLA